MYSVVQLSLEFFHSKATETEYDWNKIAVYWAEWKCDIDRHYVYETLLPRQE